MSKRQTAPARLALADGSVFAGRAFGAVGRGIISVGEIVFNTAMTGYQESLTDPSYQGQILVETFPLMGIVGVNSADVESEKVQVAGMVVRELSRTRSNARAQSDLSTYLKQHGVLGIEGIDTRALTRRIRTSGAMAAVLTDSTELADDHLVAMAGQAPSMEGQDLASGAARIEGQSWTESLGEWASSDAATQDRPLRVLAFDCGAKRNILRHLRQRGCDITLANPSTRGDDIVTRFERGEIDGVFVSNGPGDPAAVQQLVSALRTIVAAEPPIPVFGICLGHQLLALALGATTFKLPFGHHGANQPVINSTTGRVEITSQNHGFAVDPASLKAAGLVATHIHLNDQTIAGFRHPARPVFGVQYHPEASPGPHDGGYLFDDFIESMADKRVPNHQNQPSLS